jgi:hypothetical protein
MDNEEAKLYIIATANKELIDLLAANGYLMTSGGNAYVVGNVENGNTAMVQIQNITISKRVIADIPGIS